MKQLIDETGNVYGKITVISRDCSVPNRNSHWNVKCECGKEWVISQNKLHTGQKCCDTCRGSVAAKTRRADMIGRTFGYLTIVEALEECAGKKLPKKLYLCRCRCGNMVKCTTSALQTYKTSCGCMDYLKPSNNRQPKYMSLVGKKIKNFTVIGKYGDFENRVVCKCDCGGTTVANVYRLIDGNIPECQYCKKAKRIESHVESFLGRKFGNLTVAEYIGSGKNGHQWICECVCGNRPSVLERNLIGGSSTQCKRCRDKAHGESCIKDLTGMKFGILTVVERKEKNKSGNFKWLCKCDCGETTVVSSSNLLRNHTVSCGCAISTGEVLLARALRKNKIKFVKQKKFDGCVDKGVLRFDFYLPDYGWCIECNGHQHYRPVDWFGGEEQFATQKRRDKIKSDFCKDNFIPLIRIHYSDYKEMDRVADSITACLKRLPSKNNNLKAGDPDTRHTTQAPI